MTALIISFIFALACLLFDTHESVKGINEGIAVEGNPLIVAIWGNRPKFWQFLSVDCTIRVSMLLAAIFLPAPARYPASWYALFTGGFLLYGIKNIQGGRQWIWMERNLGKTIPKPTTIWQQIIGFWG
jgi:hypothetical protein